MVAAKQAAHENERVGGRRIGMSASMKAKSRRCGGKPASAVGMAWRVFGWRNHRRAA